MNDTNNEPWMGLGNTKKWIGLKWILLNDAKEITDNELPEVLNQVRLYMDDVPEIYKKDERTLINDLLSQRTGVEKEYI